MTDEIDQTLIAALMEDSRRSLKALAQISGLSSPSVAERLRRLEERGVLKVIRWRSIRAISAISCRPSFACGRCPASCMKWSD